MLKIDSQMWKYIKMWEGDGIKMACIWKESLYKPKLYLRVKFKVLCKNLSNFFLDLLKPAKQEHRHYLNKIEHMNPWTKQMKKVKPEVKIVSLDRLSIHSTILLTEQWVSRTNNIVPYSHYILLLWTSILLHFSFILKFLYGSHIFERKFIWRVNGMSHGVNGKRDGGANSRSIFM
jgi:hypothetical protein